MSEQRCPIKKHPDSGLLYVTKGDEATIVGCALLNQTHLEIPSVIPGDAVQYRVTSIGEAAFSYMSELRTVSLPASLLRIGHGAFEHSGLTEITLQDALTALAPYAFFGCVKLHRVVLAKSLTSLPEQSFGGCEALTAEDVVNLDSIPAENRSDCGLIAGRKIQEVPEITRNQGFVPVNPSPMVLERAPQKLLRQGLALEEEGQHSDAALYYMQAHRLRAAAIAEPDMKARAADLNAITEAEYHLGVLLKLSLAPVRNEDGSLRPSAAELLQSVAESSSIADAMYHLGDMYAGGYGMTDPAKALQYLKKAVALGHERACLDLAYVYLDGTLDHASTDAALLYLRKCADFDGPYAAIALGEIAALTQG